MQVSAKFSISQLDGGVYFYLIIMLSLIVCVFFSISPLYGKFRAVVRLYQVWVTKMRRAYAYQAYQIPGAQAYGIPVTQTGRSPQRLKKPKHYVDLFVLTAADTY